MTDLSSLDEIWDSVQNGDNLPTRFIWSPGHIFPIEGCYLTPIHIPERWDITIHSPINGDDIE